MTNPVWLDVRVVLAIHDEQLAIHGGSPGLRDEGLLQSALARPQQRHAYDDPAPDLATLAAALAFGLARNDPFIDGNKRTAAVCCETFLVLNGAALEATDTELYVRYLALAEGKLSEDRFAAWLRGRLQVEPRNRLHEPRPKPARRRRPVLEKARIRPR